MCQMRMPLRWLASLMLASFNVAGANDNTVAATVSVVCAALASDLEITWDAVPGAVQYDLQMGVPGMAENFGGHHTTANETSMVVKNLIPKRVYWFQLLARAPRSESGLDWHAVSERKECFLPQNLANTAGVDARAPSRRRGYFIVDMIRKNPTYDGMDNHNAADAKGQAYLISTGWHVDNCKLALYHIHIRKRSFPNQVTPRGAGKEHYANYMSCNPHQGGHGGYQCASINDADCRILGVQGGFFGGGCNQARDNSFSKDHVGMGEVNGNGGRWYSCPYAGHKYGNWKRDKQYLKATCHRGMTESQIKKAFHLSAALLSMSWEADVPAFSTDVELDNQSNSTEDLIVV